MHKYKTDEGSPGAAVSLCPIRPSSLCPIRPSSFLTKHRNVIKYETVRKNLTEFVLP